MARLHEYQGKELLAKAGLKTPEGRIARTPDEARKAAAQLGGKVVLKAQAWVTGRAAKGGILFAGTPEEAAGAAQKLLSLRFGNFPVEEILIEKAIDIRDEIFVSLTIDDAMKAPLLLLDFQGGSGIEDRAASVHRLPVDVGSGINRAALDEAVATSSLDAALHKEIGDAIERIVDLAKQADARSLEVNPLVTTHSGEIMAADCRITIDDYAVFRHPEFGIEIARELDHPATTLERIAYAVEQADHRGTFYFAQLPTEGAEKTRGVIGFHGAGGGGSMMSMDAVTNAGFTLANFCDTSGNPSSAKVYRAARIILSQPGLVGYFGSGSGVASQEQYHSAYGLAKAFIEMRLAIPAVIRLGGNAEDRAVEVLEDACRNLPAPVEGYKKDDTPASCAERFAELVEQSRKQALPPMQRQIPAFVGTDGAYSFSITGGTVWINHAACDEETSQTVIANSAELLTLNSNGKPVLAVSEEEIAKRDSELIACEIECLRAGKPVVFVDLPLVGIDTGSMDKGN